MRDGTSLDRATTDAQTFDHKRHEAAYETPQPSIREAAQEKAPDTGRNALTPGYEEVKVIRYSSITESLVNECLCSLGGWVALVPVEVIASAPEVELDLLEGEEGKPPVE